MCNFFLKKTELHLVKTSRDTHGRGLLSEVYAMNVRGSEGER